MVSHSSVRWAARRRSYRPWRRIATAIAAEDGDLARTLAERHVEHNLRRLTLLRLAVVEGY